MALSADRPTPTRDGKSFVHPVAAAAVIYAGAIVVLDAAGDAKPGVTALALKGAGRAEARADNNGGLAGAITVPVTRGTFRWANSGADPVDRTHIGGAAYCVDDQTIAATDGGGTRSSIGTIRDLDAQGVWVEI